MWVRPYGMTTFNQDVLVLTKARELLDMQKLQVPIFDDVSMQYLLVEVG